VPLIDRAKDIVKLPTTLNPLAPLPEDELEEPEELQMTLVEHLDELRSRLVKSAMGIGIATAIAFFITPWLFDRMIAMAPDNIKTLYFRSPPEGFMTFFSVALMAGIGLSSWWIGYQVLMFVAPALTRREKRLLYSFLPLIIVFFLLGVSFGYFVTVPFALKYLLSFTLGGLIQPLIDVGEYISFITTFLLWMGLAFELPIIIFFLSKIGLLSVPRLRSYRKYAILAAFVIAAVITPTPDPLNQCLVAIPLWILYEVGIVLARLA
jgi:sec-independent protein translocase protein TatC